jgi:hypothetical protein
VIVPAVNEIPLWKADPLDPIAWGFEAGYQAALAKQDSRGGDMKTEADDYYSQDKGLSAADSDRVRAAARALVGSSDARVQGLYSKCLGLLSGSQDGMGDESDALLAKAAELRKSDTSLSQYDALVLAGKDLQVTAGARARTEALAKAGGHLPAPAGSWDHLGYDPDNPTPSPGDLAKMIGR